ncbi:MAG TPA: 30S ribosomal protein S6 [Conexibacter sp.]|nr:30S ribosomal protein S6 [Conexibacter sp.]
MTQLPPIYDLMVLLSAAAEDERRARILADVEQTIADNGGAVELKQEWGMRRLAFEIAHTADAEYHLLQFSGPPALVEALSYNLKITDGVLRHRIIKVTPGTPPPPEPTLHAPVAAEAEAEAEQVAAGAEA